MNKKKQKVFVGVSGGVDSSVSLALLKNAGHDVVGVFIRTWSPDFLECTWRDERRDAMRVCAHLDVPFLECDAEEAYKKEVAEYMIEEYKKGRTPNPDVMCNRKVKFGVFWDFAKTRGADYIATGHYAKILPPKYNSLKNAHSLERRVRSVLGAQMSRDKLLTSPSLAPAEVFKDYILAKGNDIDKDQSYFLWTLTQEDLSHTLFPIGHLEKSAVRKLAQKFGLPTSEKKDSQGVCFLGPLDMKDFLKHYIDTKEGVVQNTKGENIGTHDGALFYTLGERHGFHIEKKTPNDNPYYVVKKDIEKNILVVSQNKDEFKNQNEFVNLGKVVKRGEFEKEKEYRAQVRYHGEFLSIEIIEEDKDTLKIKFLKQDNAIASGQSVVIYDGDICLAGGVIL